MSIFGKILGKIFGTESHAATAAPTATAGSSPAGAAAGAAPARAPAGAAAGAAPARAPGAAPAAQVDVVVVLTKLAAETKETLDWKRSIVDLMKLLKLDSSLAARKELAQELGYTGDTSDSASMNVWLHKQVMRKLAENGGRVPDDLKN